MQVLLHLNKPFLPVLDGGTAASYAFYLDLKSKGYDITVLCHSSEKHPFDASLFEGINIVELPVSLEIKPFSLLFSLLTTESYHLKRFYRPQHADTIRQVIQSKHIDLYIMDSLYASAYLDKLDDSYKGKLWLRAHNVEHQIWDREAKATNGLKGFILNKLSRKLKQIEMTRFKQMDRVLCISREDETLIKSYSPKNTVYYPYFPIQKTRCFKSTSSDLFFLGAMNWSPNQHSVKELVNAIFPAISKKCPNTRLRIAGTFFENLKINAIDPNIEFTGFVEDIEKFYSESGILVVPMQVGGGVRVKMMEALSHGTPIVTTPIGAQGLPVELKAVVFIAEHREEFIDICIQLCQNEQLRKDAFDKIQKAYSVWLTNRQELKHLDLDA